MKCINCKQGINNYCLLKNKSIEDMCENIQCENYEDDGYNAVLVQIDKELEEFKTKAKVALFDYASLEQILYFRGIFEDYKVISETEILDAKEVKLPNGETDCYNVFISQKELADTGEVETETFYVCNKDKVIKFSTDEI